MFSLSRGSADLLPIAETDDRDRSCQEEWNECLTCMIFLDGALITSLSIGLQACGVGVGSHKIETTLMHFVQVNLESPSQAAKGSLKAVLIA
jgi:hypothetical protein